MDAKHTASVDNLLGASTSSNIAIISAADPGGSKSSDEQSKDIQWLKANWKRALEVAVLSSVILLVCGLFSIPTILYALPPLQANEDASINTSHLCIGNLENVEDGIILCQNTSVQQPDDETICAVGFYLDNSSLSVCVPHCRSWLNITVSDIVFATSLSLAIITCIALFVIMWFQRHILFVFPTFYLLYVCVAVLLEAPFLIVGSLFKSEVFCSSDNFIESMMNSSPFCTISGIINSYVVAQLTLLVTFHALGLCWGVAFPFHYRRFKTEGRIEYIHAATVVLGLILPAIPALLHLIYGYSIAVGPISVCVVRSKGVSYFTLTLPISIFMAMSASSLVILFWKLFKEFILKQFHLQGSNSQVTKAEIKIFVIMCYYVVMGSFTLSTYAYHLATDDGLISVLIRYFACQSGGIQPDKDCGEAPDIRLQEFDVVATVSFVLQSLLPLVVFIFIVNCSCSSRKHLKTLSTSKGHATSEQCASKS